MQKWRDWNWQGPFGFLGQVGPHFALQNRKTERQRGALALAHLDAFHPEQSGQLFQLAGNVPHSHSAMMRRAMRVPLIHEFSHA